MRIKQLQDELCRLNSEQERLQIELTRVNREKKLIEKQIKEEKKSHEEKTELEEKIYQSMSKIVGSIKRTTSRNDQDRLILSVERMDFSEDSLAGWTQVMFITRKKLILLKNEENEFTDSVTERMTSFQLKILAKNSSLDQKWIRRSDLSTETGKWEYLGPADRLISCGGEAIVLKTESVQYSSKKSMAVRVQAFDPNLFVDDFSLDSFLVEINVFSDFANAVAPTKTEAFRNGRKPPKDSRPCHKNVLKHYYNIRFFDKIDDGKQDCLEHTIIFTPDLPHSLVVSSCSNVAKLKKSCRNQVLRG
ncbi:Oidioi.mRNA.OKI2018_I69.chr2.g3973.t2.cds [Oikopleura dioica]|uniref:Oidioi.mRNA.OKI2018_I69.chr2.g3973.t2.cds n=1 Tax=Oikopleura dioica TaxID=34765 RepID=A0ABN7SVV4_OIKDI|nr:Oidioi.mRNA.OKI2018_I69.chr2.g3973.t2.cds [Oikopleura dioica]